MFIALTRSLMKRAADEHSNLHGADGTHGGSARVTVSVRAKGIARTAC